MENTFKFMIKNELERLYMDDKYNALYDEELINKKMQKSLYDEGLEQGIEQGIEKTEYKFIMNMAKKGITPNEICSLTGISIDRINKLLNKHE